MAIIDMSNNQNAKDNEERIVIDTKTAMHKAMAEVDKECAILQDRIKYTLADLTKVETLEDLVAFAETHHLEKGFIHIRLV